MNSFADPHGIKDVIWKLEKLSVHWANPCCYVRLASMYKLSTFVQHKEGTIVTPLHSYWTRYWVDIIFIQHVLNMPRKCPWQRKHGRRLWRPTFPLPRGQSIPYSTRHQRRLWCGWGCHQPGVGSHIPVSHIWHTSGIWLMCAEYRQGRHPLWKAAKDLASFGAHGHALYFPLPAHMALETHRYVMPAWANYALRDVSPFTDLYLKSTEAAIQKQNEVAALIPFCLSLHSSMLLKLSLLF